MARKKEPDLEQRNRDRIAQIASDLFKENGVESTTMNDIAKSVGMSKSTLYVYFKNKEEVQNYLSLQAMNYFYQQLTSQVDRDMELHSRYLAICQVLVEFKKNYPLSFQLIVEEICVEEQVLKEDAVLAEIYRIGEAVNQFLFTTIGMEIDAPDQSSMFLQIFGIWGSIYGIITLADNKEKYLRKMTGISKEAFLQDNLERLYQSIPWR